MPMAAMKCTLDKSESEHGKVCLQCFCAYMSPHVQCPVQLVDLNHLLHCLGKLQWVHRYLFMVAIPPKVAEDDPLHRLHQIRYQSDGSVVVGILNVCSFRNQNLTGALPQDRDFLQTKAQVTENSVGLIFFPFLKPSRFSPHSLMLEPVYTTFFYIGDITVLHVDDNVMEIYDL